MGGVAGGRDIGFCTYDGRNRQTVAFRVSVQAVSDRTRIENKQGADFGRVADGFARRIVCCLWCPGQ